ncbi:MAG: pyridoxal-phosphate dependent enzyme [Parvularculaceae bacterium]
MARDSAPQTKVGPDGVNALGIEYIEAAAAQLEGRVMRTPLVKAEKLSALTGADLWLKLESLQYTGAFKERGALVKLLKLSDDEKKRGVIAASAGNHAQGVARHAKALGVPATIVMPATTPDIKIRQTRAFGVSHSRRPRL